MTIEIETLIREGARCPFALEACLRTLKTGTIEELRALITSYRARGKFYWTIAEKLLPLLETNNDQETN